METRTLFRPVGLVELKLIKDTGYTAFPPRLPDQPIFYPVLNFDYAEQIATRWNSTDETAGYMGAVTRFELPADYLAQFPERTVGGAIHKELWIPAEELENFNQRIVGKIEVVAAYYDERFTGEREW